VQRQIERYGDAQTSLRALGAGEAADDWERCGACRDLTRGIAAMAAPDPSLQVGENLGVPTSPTARYVIMRRHASGGLGEVFLARDGELNRDVALKGIQPRYADDDDLRARFILEAEITGGLEHPNIVPVHSLGKDDNGRPFYVMRFIRGESLMDAVRRFHSEEANGKQAGQRTLLLRRLLSCFVDVCNATAFAHSRGVIHRDLKPENVMLGPYGETLLLDWGLAKLVERDANATAVRKREKTLFRQCLRCIRPPPAAPLRRALVPWWARWHT
jgi:serine/threonine protein kinase